MKVHRRCCSLALTTVALLLVSVCGSSDTDAGSTAASGSGGGTINEPHVNQVPIRPSN